jgi:hypothetical protein
MFSNATRSNSFDGILIDDRNERPLTVALATIVMVWSVVFALTATSAHLRAPSAQWVGDTTTISAPLDK